MTIDKLITHIAESNPKTLDAEKVIKEARQLKAKSKKKYEIPEKQQVAEYFEDKGDMIPKDIPREAQKFMNHYEERDWQKPNGKRIKYWKKQASTWNLNYQNYNEQRLKRYEQAQKDQQGNGRNGQHSQRVDLGKIDKETDEIFRSRSEAQSLS